MYPHHMLYKRPREAVNKLELAIRRDRNRIDTRKKLITAYELMAMKDMVLAQEKALLLLEEDKKRQQASGTLSTLLSI